VKGGAEFGLGSRSGILCNVSVGGGIGSTGAIVSAGLLGDKTGGTQLSISGSDLSARPGSVASTASKPRFMFSP